ncbi:hypothetical protein BCR39DRAFT_513559 [Naematelia encephala]|uniref:Thioredoxin domain-containing protein n=1 Tax=Naematelia encephala TaxID=71784 RepID=A0A1Y2BIJ2_9TREE|nr:hypothetical protein BCR39DRAFT_513559 [Naematelia encephala]
MTLIETSYPPPDSAIASTETEPTFLIFFSTREGGQLWCPHCRDVEGIIDSTFKGASKPKGVITHVGSFAEWKTPSTPHPARAKYGVEKLPTIVKLQNGKIIGRAPKADIVDAEKLDAFLTL